MLIKMIRIAFIDSSSLISYFLKNEKANKNIKEMVHNQDIICFISPISIGEVINNLKRRLKEDKKSLAPKIWIFASLLGKKFHLLQLPDKDISKFHDFIINAKDSFTNWADNSPTDAFIASTLEFHYKNPSGKLYSLIGESTPFFVSNDKKFCSAMKNKGYFVYNPEKETIDDFLLSVK